MASQPARTVVFVDYQNVYMGARSCFGDQPGSHTDGQIKPRALGDYLAGDSPFPRVLSQIRLYRGLPDGQLDPSSYSAAFRQIKRWRRDSCVRVFPRPLAYPHGWPDKSAPGEKPREKGIDVALAIDFVMMAALDEYDVGILMSTDTDLKPALEAVTQIRGARGTTNPRAEVAAWSGENVRNRRLSIRQAKLWCHWLDKTAYDLVRDDTDYAESAWASHAHQPVS